MPSKPNIRCAGTCGRLIWPNYKSAGSPMCLACRRADSARPCKACGKPFNSHGSYVNCPECRTPHLRGQVCSEPDCDNLQDARGLCKTHYNRWYYGPDGPGFGKTRNGQPDKRRERNRMQTRRRRARVRDPQADDIYVDVVGERDGWRCGVPGCRRRRIDPAKAYPHPLSPSIDHIEPLSLGGLHTYANVRIAHLRCNIERSNVFEFEQLALIG